MQRGVLTWLVRTEKQREEVVQYLQDAELPLTVRADTKVARSLEQNRLQHLWHCEAAAALKDETPEDKRAYAKLHFGVPILRNEEEDFRAQYDKLIRPLPYAQKLELMKTPIDFPVSRLMTVDQYSRFLDAIADHYRGQGVQLTL